jgi:hypothetical protein
MEVPLFVAGLELEHQSESLAAECRTAFWPVGATPLPGLARGYECISMVTSLVSPSQAAGFGADGSGTIEMAVSHRANCTRVHSASNFRPII